MGCAASTMDEDSHPFLQEKKINDLIEQQIQNRRRNEKSVFKLLLLGGGESGKSTVLKQLRLLHKGGFTQPERIQYAQIIWVDLIQSMKILIIQARKKGIQLDCDQVDHPLYQAKQLILRIDPLHQIETDAAGGNNFLNDYVTKYSDTYRQRRQLNLSGRANDSFTTQEVGDGVGVGVGTAALPASSGAGWSTSATSSPTLATNTPPEGELDGTITEDELLNELQKVSNFQIAEPDKFKVATAISSLWKEDLGIRKIFEKSNDFQLETNTSYYFENVFNFADPNYTVTDLDILKGRIKTTGITENDFKINSFNFKVLDAGGQRSERKKWIHFFEGVTAILFVVALSEYDQFLFEDEKVNRMHEAIILFESLTNSKWFINTPFIIFLNKMDLFEEKLKKSPLNHYFPDYQGDIRNTDEATQYFTNLFLLLNRTRKPVYIHKTCATDTRSMEFVLKAVTDVIIQQNLMQSGII